MLYEVITPLHAGDIFVLAIIALLPHQGSQQQDEWKHVITSYSIHYTKLYDGVEGGTHALHQIRGDVAALQPFDDGFDRDLGSRHRELVLDVAPEA